MKKLGSICLLILATLHGSQALSQTSGAPVRVFGYFQNTLEYHEEFANATEVSTFMVQQLNLFIQKDLAAHWKAMVNFEVLNNYSSSRNWGSLNLEEAWVSYRQSEKFKLKLGLQIPIFNNLNEIKNRTPLLPYIIRPLMYETSFNEIIAIEEAIPSRAFVQISGFLPKKALKFDYAAYLGNSDNVNDNPVFGQTGLDTTVTFLYGGRVGLRYGEVKIGLSATYEKRNNFVSVADSLGVNTERLREMPKSRLGGDFSFNWDRFSFESEFITADQFNDTPLVDLDLDFYYATLAYQATEALLVYGSYWVSNANVVYGRGDRSVVEDEELKIPNVGMAYDLNDRIRLKAQFARVRLHSEFIRRNTNITFKESFNFINAAVSVLF